MRKEGDNNLLRIWRTFLLKNFSLKMKDGVRKPLAKTVA